MASSQDSSLENESLMRPRPNDEGEALDVFRILLVEQGMLSIPEKDQDTDRMLRFLRSAFYDNDKAVTAWKEMYEWRVKYQVDSIMEDFECDWVADIHPYYPQGYHGTDKKGQPIYIDCFGKADFRRMNYISQDRFLKAYIQSYEKLYAEKLPACSERVAPSERIQCMTRIVDFAQNKEYATCGLNFIGYRNGDHDLFNQLTKIGLDYYPQSINRIYVINTPFIFRLLYKVFGWMYTGNAEELHSMVTVLGSNYQDRLLQDIAEDQLPRDLGGSCVCPGKGGCLTSDRGIWNDNINNINPGNSANIPHVGDASGSGDTSGSGEPSIAEPNLYKRLHKLARKCTSLNKELARVMQIVESKQPRT